MLTPVQRMAVAATLIAGGLVIAYWALLFFAQRSMLFPIPPLTGAPPRPPQAEQVWLTTSFGRVEAWYLPAMSTSKERSPLLLFTHGNLIRYLVARVLRLPYEAWAMMDIAHCGMTELRVYGSGFEALINFNDTGHLPPSLITTA